MKIKKLIQKLSDIETIEEKSFWVIAPMVAIVGMAGLATSNFYESNLPTIVSAILCLIIPILLMIYVSIKKDYHVAYPLLCIFIGAFSVPLTFVFSGGFLSGMPLFCNVSTAISALCYSKNWRYISLSLCLLGNFIAFGYIYFYGTPFPLETEQAIFNDIIFGYIFSAVFLFYAINIIITEIRKYKISQDVLQQYFDIEVRNEILKKAVNNELSLSSGDQKVVILFADISNFTTITEKMPPNMIADFLNEFFEMAGKYIHETGGVIDKYIGDCIMAYWFEKEESNCVYNAVNACQKLRAELLEKAETIYERYGTELNFSAGIAYGNAIFSDIGSDNMHSYTVIGDAVNTASRIQDFAVGSEILLSDLAAKEIKDFVKLESVEKDLYFKGKNKSIDLYRVVEFNTTETGGLINIEEEKGYILYICGCRGSFPVSGLRFSEYGGETSCYVLKKDDYAVVVDCGTGLKNAMDILSDCKKIDILLTHVHYDHILGLLMAKLPDVEIRAFGYFKKWNDSNTLVNFMEHPYWPVEIKHMNNISIELGKEIVLSKDIKVYFYKSDHPDDGCVIELMCANKKVCFFADCEDITKLDSRIGKGADLLFFDGMFDENDTVDHTGWGHGTWQAGVKYAQTENIKKLIITHHSPEVGDHTLHTRETMARELAMNVSFAKAGDHIVL